MPAHGTSPGRSTDLFKMADAIHHVATEFGPLYGVIAHSLGSAALLMSLSHGLQVDRVVCISPPSHTTWMVE